MKYILTKEQITIPDDVTVSAKSREVVVIGFISISIIRTSRENKKKF